MERIDNTEMVNQALEIVEAANLLIKRLDRDNPNPTLEKAKTLAAIKLVLSTQSKAIQNLVEDRAAINDQLNHLMERHSL